eukprot:gene11139-1992_t
MAVLLIVSEFGPPPPGSPLARSVREINAADHVTVDTGSNVIATLMTDSTTTVCAGAIERLVHHLATRPELDVFYGDSSFGPSTDTTTLRPAWSPIRLLTMPTDLDHLVVRGRHTAGSLTDRIEVLTTVDADRIGHIPDVLVEVSVLPELDAAARSALERAAMTRSVTLEPFRPDRFRLTPTTVDAISVVIPTAATAGAN